jgi:hypothetical protein
MRLIPTSRHYLCRQCRYHFVSFPPVPYFFGIFLLLLGMGVPVSVLSPDTIGIGYSGFSPLEKTGTVLGSISTIIDF